MDARKINEKNYLFADRRVFLKIRNGRTNTMRNKWTRKSFECQYCIKPSLYVSNDTRARARDMNAVQTIIVYFEMDILLIVIADTRWIIDLYLRIKSCSVLFSMISSDSLLISVFFSHLIASIQCTIMQWTKPSYRR